MILIHCLGAGAVEFIISHAEISVVFVEEKKLPEVHTDMMEVKNCVSYYF